MSAPPKTKRLRPRPNLIQAELTPELTAQLDALVTADHQPYHLSSRAEVMRKLIHEAHRRLEKKSEK